MVKEIMIPKKILIIANANSRVFFHPLLELPLLRHITAILNRVYGELIFQLRIIPAIKKRQNDKLVIYAVGEFLQQKLRARNIPLKPMRNPIDMSFSGREPSQQADDLFFSWRRIEDNEKYRELLRYNGVSILDTGALFIHNSLREILFLVNYLSEIIEKEQPEEIIVTEDDIIGRTASIIGQPKGIPTTILGRSTNDVIRKFKMGGRFLVRGIAFVESLKYRLRRLSAGTHGSHEVLKNKIVVFAACPSDVNTIAPVVKVLKEKDEYELIILGVSKSGNRLLKDKNLSFKTFEDYVDRGLRRKMKDEESALRTKLEVLKNDEGFKNTLKYMDLPLWSLIEGKIELLFTMDLGIETIKHVFEVEMPDLLVTLSMGQISSLRVANALAKMRGIPTLFVTHSVYAESSRMLSTISSDKIAVCGDDSKENFINAGVNPQRIVITGQPRFDVYFKKDNGSTDKIKRKLGIDPRTGIILLIPQTNGPFSKKESEALLKGIFSAMKEFPKHHLVVKLHPDESDRLTREIANKMQVKDVTIIKDMDLIALLKSCDVVLTIFSNVGVEAMILDKPVVIIDLTEAKASNEAKYTQGRAVLRVFSSKEIAPAIRNVLENPKVKRDLKTHRKTTVYNTVYKSDGKASERVADLIEDMVKKKG